MSKQGAINDAIDMYTFFIEAKQDSEKNNKSNTNEVTQKCLNKLSQQISKRKILFTSIP